MLSQLGIEASPAVHYAIAFAIIFILLTLFALVLRRLTGRRSALSGPGGRARQPRLGIVDVYDLDRQRQLILLRRDNVEHLLLIGGPNDVMVESSIVRVPGARLNPAEAPQERVEADRFPEALPPRPVVETLPTRPVPEQVERPRAAGAPVAAPEVPAITASMQPSPMRTDPILKPDVVALRPERSLPRAADTMGGSPSPAPQRREPPPRPTPVPPPASRMEPEQPEPSPDEEARGPDAAILSDMARQLEEALKRPGGPARNAEAPVPQPAPRAEPRPAPPPTPLRPPPPAPPAPGRTPPPPAPLPRPAPRPQATMASAPPPPAPASPPPAPAPPPPARPAPFPGPQPLPQTPARTAAEAPPPPPPDEAEQRGDGEPAPPRVSDPFSVEEIEAEFARLLGRPFEKAEKPHP